MPRIKIKRPDAKKPSHSGRSQFIKILLLLILIPVIAAAVFLIRYYYIFEGTIEMKLGRRNQMAKTKIFAAPTVLYPGKRIGCSELVSRIRRLGYEESSAGASYYQIGKADTLLVHNEGSVPSDANRTAEINAQEIPSARLRILPTRQNLREFSLKPELFSNTINKSREKRRYVSYQEMPKVLIERRAGRRRQAVFQPQRNRSHSHH